MGLCGKIGDIRLEVDTIPGVACSTGLDGSAAFFNQRWLEYIGLYNEQALDRVGRLRHILMASLMLETFHEALGVDIASIGRSHRVMRDDRFDAKPSNSLASCLARDFEERIIGPF